MRAYVGVGALLQLTYSVLYDDILGWIAAVLFLIIGYFLLKGVRWLWLLMTGSSALFVVVYLAALRLNAVVNLIALLLLLAPPTRRHFARDRTEEELNQPGADTLGKKMTRRLKQLMESPMAIKAFAVVVFAYEVARLFFGMAPRFDAQPGRVVFTIAMGIAIYSTVSYLMLRGSRIMWMIGIGVLTFVVVLTTGRGDWPEALVPALLVGLLMLPVSVAFVWRDRRQADA